MNASHYYSTSTTTTERERETYMRETKSPELRTQLYANDKGETDVPYCKSVEKKRFERNSRQNKRTGRTGVP